MTDRIAFIFVDGGGSGSRLRACDARGQPMKEVASGPANLTFGVAPAWRALGAGIRALEQRTDLTACGTALWCGLAGGRSVELQAQFRAEDPVGCAQIEIVTDGFASLIGALDGAPGTVLAVGTGTTAFAQHPDGRLVSSSGWGYKIGDEGSGGWIGRRAMALLSRALDWRGPTDSVLFARMQEQVGADYDTIQTWLATADPTRFASLTPLVIEAATAGDTLAETLLQQAAEELVLAIRAVDAGGPLALLGGLATTMQPRLPAHLRARVITPRGNALDGMQRLARHAWTNETHVPPGGLTDG